MRRSESAGSGRLAELPLTALALACRRALSVAGAATPAVAASRAGPAAIAASATAPAALTAGAVIQTFGRLVALDDAGRDFHLDQFANGFELAASGAPAARPSRPARPVRPM